MLKRFLQFKVLYPCIVALLLSSCLGGTVAQQIARSIATSVADKALARAMDVDEENNGSAYQQPQAKNLPTAKPDEMWFMMASGGFEEVSVSVQDDPVLSAKSPAEEASLMPSVTTLVRVEVLNLLAGAEKQNVYEKARLIGALNLPQAREWQSWHVATGIVENDKRLITFLVPPQMGKLPSGTKTVVEIANIGDLNIARYPLN